MLSDLKNNFDASKSSIKLIYINIAVFITVALLKVFGELFNLWSSSFVDNLQLPSSLEGLNHKPWSILTYMFLHLSFWHLLFNMLCLYWFGQFFLMRNGGKQLISLYLFGGIIGGLAYILSYEYLSYFAGKTALLCGASASIMSLIVASAFQMPTTSIFLLFLGRIQLKWIAVATLLVSVLSITSSNAGGEIAHIGGALAGWIWFMSKKSSNFLEPIDYIITFFVNIFRRKPKMKVHNPKQKYHYVKSDEQYRVEKKQNSQQLDTILDKIRKSGYESLTEEEKKKLFEVSNKV